MSEKEFDLYLSLLGRFLKLSPNQRAEIADELRDHLEERLEELTDEGLSRDDAIRRAIDEFGDASELATHFTQIARRRRRRLIMRLTAGTALTASAAVLLAIFLRPEMPPQRAAGQLVAQEELGDPEIPAAEIGAAAEGPANVPDPLPTPDAFGSSEAAAQPTTELTTSESVEEKLKQPLDVQFDASTLSDALAFISHKLEVDIFPDWRALGDEQIDKDVPMTFGFQYTKLSAGTVLDLILEPLQCSYIVREGFIYVSTDIAMEEQEDYLEFRVYNVRDLLEKGLDADDLTKLVQFARNAAWSDDDGFGGMVEWYDGLLAIRQSQDVHRQIDDIFQKLRAADVERPWGPDKPQVTDGFQPGTAPAATERFQPRSAPPTTGGFQPRNAPATYEESSAGTPTSKSRDSF